MEEVEIMVPTKIYRTKDNKEFAFKQQAEDWENQLYFHEHMQNNYIYLNGNHGLIFLRSRRELEIASFILRQYYSTKGLFAHYIPEDTKFPILVEFDESRDKPTWIVNFSRYEELRREAEKYTKLCELFKKANPLIG